MSLKPFLPAVEETHQLRDDTQCGIKAARHQLIQRNALAALDKATTLAEVKTVVRALLTAADFT